MPWYQDAEFFRQVKLEPFDQEHQPGVKAPFAGIYRCMGCHREIAIAFGHTLPPQDHHSHTAQQGAIRWRLVAFADHDPK